MRRQNLSFLLSACATILLARAWFAFGGDLDPPAGAVAPTMKTLSEVEPRIAINATNTPGDADSVFRIAAPGSYYLTGNITGEAGKSGIEIAASDVSLNLMGFSVTGTAGSFNGVSVSGSRNNLSIINGSLTGWGGLGVAAGSAESSVFEHLRVAENGSGGLYAGASNSVTACTAKGNLGFYGIRVEGSTVSQCTARNNVQVGIRADLGSVIADCTASSNGAHGIRTDSHCIVRNCIARLNTGDGFLVSNDCFLIYNLAADNGFNGDGAGIHATSSDNRIEGNNCTDSDRGIDVDDVGNLIIRNSASGNTTNYDIVASNTVGPTVTSANIAASTNPHANYDF